MHGDTWMADPPKALVVGAGIGGLAAGLALRRRGWDIGIYERAASPRELGFGLLLAPNALAALDELGIANAVVGRAAFSAGVEIRRLNGQLVRRLDAQLFGPSVVALRRDLHGTLLNAVGDDALKLGTEAVAVTQSASGVTIHLKDGSVDTADVLIGADGVNSTIRKHLHPNEQPPRASGFSAVRGVAHGVSAYLTGLSAIGYLDDGIEAAAAQASSDAIYWYVSLISNELPPGTNSAEIALHSRLPHFDASMRAIIAATKPDDMRFDNLLQREPLKWWGIDRVTLLGDAAHPLLPHTGQGAAQALEDAVALGIVLSPTGNVAAALRRYEEVRMKRTRRLIKIGPRIARVTTTRSRWIQFARTLALRLLPSPILTTLASRAQRDPHQALRTFVHM
jgi:2-polyprenyl-6-methoxyphenol hydroxylase-like FAD-dependent oxidoreductase